MKSIIALALASAACQANAEDCMLFKNYRDAFRAICDDESYTIYRDRFQYRGYSDSGRIITIYTGDSENEDNELELPERWTIIKED